MTFIDKLICFIGVHLWEFDWTNAYKEQGSPVPGKCYFAYRYCKLCNKKER